MIQKTPTTLNLEKRQAIEMGIKDGKGATYLNLTDVQYERLKGS